MAYITGSAANFADLKTAIENACTANGWSLVSAILSKSGVFVKLTTTANNIVISCGTGQSGTSLVNACPQTSKIFQPTHASAIAIVFPINYEIYLFENPDEVYCVINYNSDFYQNICFGKSDIPGLPGSGNWFGASSGGSVIETHTVSSTFTGTISVSNVGTGNITYQSYINGFPFFSNTNNTVNYNGSYINSGFDATPWNTTPGNSDGDLGGPAYCASLLAALPNLFNESSPLIPVKAVVNRLSNGKTIAATLRNLRHVRIDNLLPGEIVTLGAEQWKIYPHYRKDNNERNMGTNPRPTASGTFGVAIRYEGA